MPMMLKKRINEDLYMNKVYISEIKWTNIKRINTSFFNNKYEPLLCVYDNIFINGSLWSIICFSYQLINE